MARKPRTQEERVLEIARREGILRPRDLDRHGLARTHLQRLERRGLLERAGRGLYRLPSANLTEHHSLAAACKLVPRGVVCSLKGAWLRTSDNGQTVSALCPGHHADISEGACYNDTRVEVAALA